jgi:hypothetical protein
MGAPFRGSGSSSYQIEINWSALTGAASGLSPITSYSLWWDRGDGVTSIELAVANQTSFVVSGVTVNTNYSFWVRAKNIYGFGPFSNKTAIIAADAPNTLASVVTSL